jgi:hypothetical protein
MTAPRSWEVLRREKVRPIHAASRPLFEVLQSEDGLVVTIRSAENHEENIEFPSTVVGTLISVLQEFR